MSMYYTYYLGYMNEENQIVPLGPFDNLGNLRQLFDYNYHTSVEIHREFEPLKFQQLSEDFKSIFYKNFTPTESEPTLEAHHKNYYFAFEDLNKFINNVTSAQHFIVSGYWLIDEISNFLNMSTEEQQDFLYYEEFTQPLKPDVYAAKVLADSSVAKKYMFYAVFNRYCDDYYRYLAHIQTESFTDDWVNRDRRYVIFYSFS